MQIIHFFRVICARCVRQAFRKRSFWKRTRRMKMAEKASTRKKQSKRELVDTGKDKRYVRRNDKGQFDEVADVGKSLSQDVRKHAKTVVPAGQGDRGDRAKR